MPAVRNRKMRRAEVKQGTTGAPALKKGFRKNWRGIGKRWRLAPPHAHALIVSPEAPLGRQPRIGTSGLRGRLASRGLRFVDDPRMDDGRNALVREIRGPTPVPVYEAATDAADVRLACLLACLRKIFSTMWPSLNLSLVHAPRRSLPASCLPQH